MHDQLLDRRDTLLRGSEFGLNSRSNHTLEYNFISKPHRDTWTELHVHVVARFLPPHFELCREA